MKHIKLALGLLLVGLFIGCEHEYELPNTYSDVQWYTSMFRGENNTVGLEKYHSFSDLSRGAVDHHWSIEGVEGGHFLQGPISNADTVYYEFIKEGAGDVSNDETVHVLFTKPGLQEVQLYNTFKDHVKFEGNDTIESVYDASKDLWVIDTTFIVDVYDSIQPALKVYRDLEETTLLASHDANEEGHEAIDSTSWTDEVTIMAGEFLKFVDLSVIGRPDTRTWSSDGGKPRFTSDSAAIINFYRMGRFYVSMDSRRSGQHVPYGYRRQWVPLKINVIASTLDLVPVGNATETFDEVIQVAFNGEFRNFTSEEGNFTVRVTNESGFDDVIPVRSAKVNANDATVIDLVLDAPIYNTDVIEVDYTEGAIVSVDNRSLKSFTGVKVIPYIVNLIEDAGFESGGGMWEAMDNDNTIGVSEYSQVDPATGKYCYRLYVPAEEIAPGKYAAARTKNNFTIKGGKKYCYTYKHKTINGGGGGFEPQLCTINDKGVLERISGFWTPYKNDAGWILGPMYGWVNPPPTKHVWEAPATNDKVFIHLKNYIVSDLYFDDMLFYEYELRPIE